MKASLQNMKWIHGAVVEIHQFHCRHNFLKNVTRQSHVKNTVNLIWLLSPKKTTRKTWSLHIHLPTAQTGHFAFHQRSAETAFFCHTFTPKFTPGVNSHIPAVWAVKSSGYQFVSSSPCSIKFQQEDVEKN